MSALTVAGCLRCEGGNPYWAHCAILLGMLTWGVMMRKRYPPQRRILLRCLMGVSGGVAALCWIPAFIPLGFVDLELVLISVKASALTTACLYLELALSPDIEPIPAARVSNDPQARRS